jgi:hypothetical protein
MCRYWVTVSLILIVFVVARVHLFQRRGLVHHVQYLDVPRTDLCVSIFGTIAEEEVRVFLLGPHQESDHHDLHGQESHGHCTDAYHFRVHFSICVIGNPIYMCVCEHTEYDLTTLSHVSPCK